MAARKAGTPTDMTIDEVARRARTTARNVRAYQSRGLLPPPRLVGRKGFYGEDHLSRLRLIDDLKRRGFSLESMRELLDASSEQRTVGDLLGLARSISHGTAPEPTEVVTLAEVRASFPEGALDDPRVLLAAVALKVVEPAEGGFRILRPRLLEVGRALAETGVPLVVALDELRELEARMQQTASGFAKLFRKHVWRPFAVAGYPKADWPVVRAAFERLWPLASTAVDAAFASAIEARLREEMQALEAEARAGKA